MTNYMYGVICPECGKKELSLDNYNSQLRNVDARWKCPDCLQEAQWDDDSFVTTFDPCPIMQWYPITMRPTAGTCVMFCDINNNIWIQVSDMNEPIPFDRALKVTHWAPLPIGAN